MTKLKESIFLTMKERWNKKEKYDILQNCITVTDFIVSNNILDSILFEEKEK